LTGLLLVDKSAWARGVDPHAYDADLCICAVTEMEVLFSARSGADFAQLERALAEYRSLRIDAQTLAAARMAQRELAEQGQHRVPIPDLIVAACAAQHGAGVLHVDRHFDVLAEVLEFEAVRRDSSAVEGAFLTQRR
jgi:predicted nucleic acid-binding protein